MNAPLDQFSTHFETLALDDRTLAQGHGETIVPDSFRGAGPLDALRTLPRIGTGTAAGTTVDLEMIRTLGEGGMGIVQLARQVALNRDVAVKTLRANNETTAPKLLQEAYVTGRLEHPNIVPIYTLGRDDAGAPLIVMKRIEGVSWLDVLIDPAKALPETKVDLLWHLETLLQLCNAVRYAHRHEVIHRDIKPENVMIGLFGEVYLLDWGIAVSIADEPDAGDVLPHRDDVIGMAGTPAYMSPEMTHDRATEQDIRTDVYLLGALLHQILTGTPRHDGKTLFDVLRSAFENTTVEYPPHVAPELAAIANRAMATQKEDRFETVEAFRAAVLDYLEHRGTLELLDQADQMLDRLAELKSKPRDDDQDFAIHDLFTECRFACQQARRSWPESKVAQSMYRRYLAERLSYAVEVRDVAQARGVIAQMDEEGLETASARAELDALLQERASDEEELRGLRSLAADLDLSRGRVSRSVAVMLMGVLWASDTARGWYIRLDEPADSLATTYVESAWRVVLIGAVAMFLFRKPLFSTVANRRLSYLLITVIVAIVAFRLIFMISPGDIVALRAAEMVMYGLATISAGLLADDLRISGLGGLYFLVALLAANIGGSAAIVLAGVHLVVFIGTGFFWTPRQFAKRITL